MTAAENVAARLTDRHVQASLGDKRALDYGSKHYSYHDLAALVNRAGNLLKSFGVTPGSGVLVMMPPSPAYIATLIGALKIGATAIVEQRADVAPALAVVHIDYLSKVRGLPAEKVLVAGEAPEGYPSFLEAMRTQASSLAAEPVKPDAPALVVAGGSLSHADLDALLDGTGRDERLGSLADILRALAAARTAELS
ncbi:MAG: AMP-binding protein [Betaproteobacteria bacterium]